MNMRLIKAIALLTAITSALINPLTSSAQSNYPNKPINFIVPYGAGGGAEKTKKP